MIRPTNPQGPVMEARSAQRGGGGGYALLPLDLVALVHARDRGRAQRS